MIPVVCYRCGLQHGQRSVILPTDVVAEPIAGTQVIHLDHEKVEDCLVLLRIEHQKMLDQSKQMFMMAVAMMNRHNAIVEEMNGAKRQEKM